MRRFQRLCGTLACFVMAWLLACTLLDARHGRVTRLLLYSLPVLALAGYGLVVLAMLIHGVCTFNSVPEEAQALRQEIQEAHTFLRSKGIHVGLGYWGS